MAGRADRSRGRNGCCTIRGHHGGWGAATEKNHTAVGGHKILGASFKSQRLCGLGSSSRFSCTVLEGEIAG